MTVLAEIDEWTERLSSAYASPMPAEDEPAMSNRAFRVSDDLWERYGLACKRLATTRSDELRRHMMAVVAVDEREQRRIARESGAPADS
jgi:hypothetical protein